MRVCDALTKSWPRDPCHPVHQRLDETDWPSVTCLRMTHSRQYRTNNPGDVFTIGNGECKRNAHVEEPCKNLIGSGQCFARYVTPMLVCAGISNGLATSE